MSDCNGGCNSAGDAAGYPDAFALDVVGLTSLKADWCLWLAYLRRPPGAGTAGVLMPCGIYHDGHQANGQVANDLVRPA